MARVNVPVTTVTRAGVATATPIPGDATNGHSVVNNGRTKVVVKNTGATSRTVSFVITKLTDGETPPAKTFTLAAGAERSYGPWPTDFYSKVLQINVSHAEVTLLAETLSER
ncbi:hypothetical protein [Embleya sp. NPDC001921]